METETRACTALMLDLAHKLGKEECGTADDKDRLLLRLMMPVAKMYTGKRAVSVVSEGLECFGGQGYIEDTGLPGMLRDAQVSALHRVFRFIRFISIEICTEIILQIGILWIGLTVWFDSLLLLLCL